MIFYCSAQTIRSESGGGWKLFNLRLSYRSNYLEKFLAALWSRYNPGEASKW